MSVSYPEASTKTSTARKTGREFALPSSGVKLPVDSQPAEVIDSSQDEVGKPPAGRTPSASEALFSIGELTINGADQLRLLMHESLTSFAVEIGTQIALSLLEDDVNRLCGEKSQRVLDRVNNRHGTHPRYISSEVREWPFGDLGCGKSATSKLSFSSSQTCRPKTRCQRPRWRRWSAEFRAATTKRWSTRLARDSV